MQQLLGGKGASESMILTSCLQVSPSADEAKTVFFPKQVGEEEQRIFIHNMSFNINSR